jgi:transcriptional regulator with GAF, ATPase, and Fis domain
MNTSRIKYVILLVVVVLVALYRLFLSFNLLPYFVSGEDITTFLLLCISIFLFFLSGTAVKNAKAIASIQESMTISIQTDDLDATLFAENLKDMAGYRLLIGLQRYITNIADKDELLNKFLFISVKLTQSERASIMLHDSKKDELFIFKTMGWETREIHLAKKMKSKPGEGIAGRVFLDGEPLLVNKASDREEFDARDKYKSKSYVSLPIFKGRNIIGVLNLTEKEEGLYSKGEIDLLRFISDAVSLKLQGIESN